MKKIDVSKSLIFSRKVEDIKNSLEYLDQECYFSNSKDFSKYEEAYLDIVQVTNFANFVYRPFTCIRDGDGHSFSYFIPKSEAVFVEEEPKKKELRPFRSLEEFFNVTGFKVGDVVRIKNYVGYACEETSVITSFRVYTDEEYPEIYIIFGVVVRPLNDLFKCCKYLKNNEWLPFGVEE